MTVIQVGQRREEPLPKTQACGLMLKSSSNWSRQSTESAQVSDGESQSTALQAPAWTPAAAVILTAATSSVKKKHLKSQS